MIYVLTFLFIFPLQFFDIMKNFFNSAHLSAYNFTNFTVFTRKRYPSPLTAAHPTTHHFRYGHQPSIQQNLNHYIIIYRLRDISATNLAIFLVARDFVETPLHRTEFKDVFTSKKKQSLFLSYLDVTQPIVRRSWGQLNTGKGRWHLSEAQNYAGLFVTFERLNQKTIITSIM
jgi:hypothetical protein